jgi:hypothetical protein
MSAAMTSASEETQPTVRPRRRVAELVALLLFLVVGATLAAPTLSIEGAIRGRFTTVLVFLAFSRLAWNVHKRTFLFRDYFLYLAIIVAFCIWVEFQ